MTSPKTLLRAWNIKAKKQLGQHFLVDPSTAEMIVKRAKISSKDIVLEIGAGLGALTIPVARAAAKVYAVEKDRQLCDLLKTELLASNVANVSIIPENILQLDYASIAERYSRALVVLGNLPYNISSQVLVQLIRCRNLVSRAILMFQKELAHRIIAHPGNKEYGRLTVMLRYCADIKPVATINASAFFPAPKVASEIIEIKFKAKPDYPQHDESLLFKVIKAAFGNRRKTLKNALAASELRIDPKSAWQALDMAGIDPSRRAETLSVSEFISLQISLAQIEPGWLDASVASKNDNPTP
jgi:16S rRNA (adenine1518-N6/adenine1519-N6)-dimethyltransferase